MAGKITIIIVLAAVASLSTATPVRNRRQLPCNHYLRISAPELFTHCCDYSDWGDWDDVPGNTQSAPTSQCASGQTYMERRTRTLLSGGSNCNELTETRRVCVPDAADKLIIALGLGSSGRDYTPVGPAPGLPSVGPAPIYLGYNRPSPTHHFFNVTMQWIPETQSYNYVNRRARRQTSTYGPGRRCPRYGGTGEVCQNLAARSSAQFAEEEAIHNVEEDLDAAAAEPFLEDSNEEVVMQFSLQEHGHRFRRQVRPENCGSHDIQNVLFVFDASGSIGDTDYNRVKTAVAKLTPVFCRKVKFGLLTFSSKLNLEFCFDCFENTYDGRLAASNAIKAAKYPGQMTHTGEAARCVCQDLFNPSCGISSNPSCTDVVFITDGQSNGNLNVCNEIKCLHNKRGVNTFSIGIGNYQSFQAELDCIDDGKDRLSAFEFKSFDAFEQAIDDVIRRLAALIPTNPRSCAALYGQPTPHVIPINTNAGMPIGR